MRVEIDIENSTNSALLSALERHKPLMARWARRWRANLRAVAGQQQSVYLEPPQGIVVFRPFSSTPITTGAQKELKTVFGCALPEVADARTRLAPSGNAKHFFSPESNRIAQAQPGAFSFLFNALGYDWENAEEMANMMFACTLPKALPDGHARKRAKALRAVLKRKLRRDKKRIEAAYVPLVRQGLQEFIERHEREIREITERMAAKERERLATLGEISEIEEYLAHTEAHIKSREDIGREFEQILRMEGVGILRIEAEYSEDGKVPAITVYTESILQEFEGVKYDIGSFRIKIDTSRTGREAVRFIQDSQGSHTHLHALTAAQGGPAAVQVCFGSDLNEPINKLVADFEIVPLVHLLLTFLRLNSAHPRKNEHGRSRAAEEESRLAYTSADDRAKERDAFIAVVSEILMRVHTNKSRKRLKELLEKETAVTKDYYTARRERNELKERVKLLRQRLVTLPDSARNALLRLLANPNVLYARVFEKSLQVWFWSQKTGSIHMIWLDPKRSPWIIGYEKLDCVSNYHSFETSDEKFKRRVLKCLASGKFTQAAELLIGRILSSVR